MKMNLKLTADELMNVVDAAMDEAIDRGYDPDDEETVEDMLHIVDAALSAMGIEIVEDADAEDAAEEEYYNAFADDPDEFEGFDYEEPNVADANINELLVEYEGKKFLRESDAQQLLNFLRKTVNEKFSFLEKSLREKILVEMWCKFGEDFGIHGVLKGL